MTPHIAFQTSTIEALNAGHWDGHTTVGELRRHGTLGLGTFDGLDGEMIVVDGIVYRACADGSVAEASDAMRTPFATVVDFDREVTMALPQPVAGEELHALLGAVAEETGCPFALRFDGRLDDVAVRSVPRQQEPYTSLEEIEQYAFAIDDALGTLVGFAFPAWACALQPPGAHLHVITADRRRGGHLLDARVGPGVLRLSTVMSVRLDLPPGVAPPQMRDTRRYASVLPSRDGLRHPRRRRP
jgi:acetolactate decarboxylase